MSRGVGKLQQRILERIEATGTVSLNRLCWDLAGEQGSAAPSITDAFHSGFRRSVRRLAEDGYIAPARRRLTDIDELVAFYPYKSRNAEVKAMRLQLLPVAKAYLSDRQVRKYTPAQNETYFYRDLADDIRTGAEARWRSVEGVLFEALPAPDPRVRDAIFDLLVRGRQLFLHQPMGHRAPVSFLLGRALAAGGDRLPAVAVAKLQALSSLFPTRDLARLRFKSDLYEIAHLGRDHSPHVKDQFIEYAMREAPAAMRSLPGFKAARSEGPAKFRRPIRDEASPLVHKLVQRDALAPFTFLSVNQQDQPVAPAHMAAAEENQAATMREPRPA